MSKQIHKTRYGQIVLADSYEFLDGMEDNSIDLIITSPPFALTREKSYGNKKGDDYLDWLQNFGELFYKKLSNTGSLVIDFGGSWVPGSPTRNLHQFKIPIIFCESIGFHLAQEFFWWNTAKIPSPAQWVTVNRSRVTDSVNYIFWFSKTENPKSDNTKILKPYSAKMRNLIKTQRYNQNKRPSQHNISKTWGKNNGGAIPQNFFPYGNTARDPYLSYCDKKGIRKHPARFGQFIPEFFIRFLSDKGDLIVDPFAGSCTSGAVANALKRKWLCIDNEEEFLQGALGRFKKGYKLNIDPEEPLQYEFTISTQS